jgi:plasmid stabilization system protein ParE
MNLRLSGRALDDLDRIYAHVYAAWGLRVADQVLARIRRATRFIEQNPYAGPHPNWATRHRALRFWPISGTRFIIYYIPESDGVSIERVLDRRRDVIRILEQGIEEPPEEERD